MSDVVVMRVLLRLVTQLRCVSTRGWSKGEIYAAN